ncbi:PREDICTED: uncharacterized protein LOC104824033 isoform X2 [Tarenaya hassleriana]|uniref:uncharacterized protein LOC104824033 isoform X2 n=1 Tax=Tarenaya hassleriana TaxID=28532 RepID=UPI00053C9392|nr:PREDICTED: uncharacterized protein LOC104824033 isoform X2 [Tarenaya hassleriana]
MSEKRLCCVVMRMNLDCNACCRKAGRIILNMKVERHMIEKEDRKVIVCGRFRPSDVAIKLRKKMNRRVEILHVQGFGHEGGGDGGGGGGGGGGQEEHDPHNYDNAMQHDHTTTPLLC